MRESTVLHQQGETPTGIPNPNPEENPLASSQVGLSEEQARQFTEALNAANADAAGKQKEIDRLNAKIRELSSEPAQEKGKLPSEKEYRIFESLPHLRTSFTVKNLLDRTLTNMMRARTNHGIQGFWDKSHQHRKPGWIRRLFNIPAIFGIGAEAGLKSIPTAINTVGDVVKTSGQFVTSSIGPAVGVGIVGAAARATTDVGWWTLGKESSSDVFIRELRYRKRPTDRKGLMEFDHIFSKRKLADLNELEDIEKDLTDDEEKKWIQSHPQARERLIRKATLLKLDKMLVENKASAEVREQLNDRERLIFEKIDSVYNTASKFYEIMDPAQKAIFIYKLVPYINRTEFLGHGALILKRSVISGLGTGIIGGISSIVKSMGETGLLRKWSAQVVDTAKKSAATAYAALSGFAHNTVQTIGSWFSKWNLSWLKLGAAPQAVSVTPAPITPTAVTPGVWKFDLATILTPSGDKLQVVFPQSP